MNDEKPILDTDKEMVINKTKKSLIKRLFVFIVLFLLILIGLFVFFSFIKTPPANFPIGKTITIPTGATVQDVAVLVKENNLVRSELAFFIYFSFVENPTSIKASTYSFSEPVNLTDLAYKLTQGNYGEGLLRLTHIEGETVEDVALRADNILSEFDPVKFITLARPYEGKLFPETYMIPNTYNEQQLLDLLLKTFTEKTSSLQSLSSTSLSFDEVIILASILEREANSKESKEIVSGILQNRLKIGMPLQADATIEYVLHKPLKELTPDDLKMDSPYNTYLNKGLPPTPIGNPGLEAIEAVLYPAQTEYMFYITDENGDFYYAKDFDEHRRNIAKYLR
jgi:UPF0755 protein